MGWDSEVEETDGNYLLTHYQAVCNSAFYFERGRVAVLLVYVERGSLILRLRLAKFGAHGKSSSKSYCN